MRGTAFVDTNLLVYVRDADAGEKQVRAMDWLDHLWHDQSGRISCQVLQDYYVTVTQKLRPGIPPVDARRDVTALFAWNPSVTDANTIQQGWELQDRFGLPWWDSLIVAAALDLGCTYILSEDFQDGLMIEGVEIINPFRTAYTDLA